MIIFLSSLFLSGLGFYAAGYMHGRARSRRQVQKLKLQSEAMEDLAEKYFERFSEEREKVIRFERNAELVRTRQEAERQRCATCGGTGFLYQYATESEHPTFTDLCPNCNADGKRTALRFDGTDLQMPANYYRRSGEANEITEDPLDADLIG